MQSEIFQKNILLLLSQCEELERSKTIPEKLIKNSKNRRDLQKLSAQFDTIMMNGQEGKKSRLSLTEIKIKSFMGCNGEVSLKFGEGMSLLIGKNNAGKSTILQALVLWEHIKRHLHRDEKDLAKDTKKNRKRTRRGRPMSLGNIPLNLSSAKLLWYTRNVGSGYNMHVECLWRVEGDSKERNLRVRCDFVSDVSINVVTAASNLDLEEVKNIKNFPTIAYLPHFTNPLPQEPYYPNNLVDLMITEGKTGEVLRNIIYRLKNDEKRAYSELMRMLKNYFSFDAKDVEDPPVKVGFDKQHDTHIVIEKALKPHKGRKRDNRKQSRDIITEGSGCLQWLCVFAYALRPEIDVLLLDEPDAHMHGNLQVSLFEELRRICGDMNKQIIVSTHSSRMIEKSKGFLENGVSVINVKDLSVEKKEGKVGICKSAEDIDSALLDVDERILKSFNIFVEGESDEIVFGKVLKVLLNKNRWRGKAGRRKVRVWKMGGQGNVGQYYEFCGEEDCFFILDDEEGVKNTTEKLKDGVYRVLSGSLETLYPEEIKRYAKDKGWFKEKKDVNGTLYLRPENSGKIPLAEYAVEQSEKDERVLEPFYPAVEAALEHLLGSSHS